MLGLESEAVDEADDGVEDAEDEHLLVDELVDGTLPAEQQTGEGKEAGAGHLARVRDCHVAVELEQQALAQMLPQGASH